MTSQLAGVRTAVEAHLGGLPRGDEPVRLGVPEAAKPVTIAALAALHERPTLVVVASPGRALLLAEELALYAGDLPIARLPAGERLPYELAEDDPAAIAERDRALRMLRARERSVVVVSWAALAEFRAGPEVQGAGTEVQVGATLAPEALQRALEERGYRLEALADEPGVAARRGGILDVFPAGAEEPLRIEFFGDEVESIRRIDLATQRSIERVQSALLPPLASHTAAAQERARALRDAIDVGGEGAEAITQELELLAGGERSRFPGYFEPLLNQATAFDYLAPESLVVVDEREEGAEALAQHVRHQEEARAALERRGEIPGGLPALGLEPESGRAAAAGPPSARRAGPFRGGGARGGTAAVRDGARVRGAHPRGGAAGGGVGAGRTGGGAGLAAGPSARGPDGG